jgi:hypothetical protein
MGSRSKSNKKTSVYLDVDKGKYHDTQKSLEKHKEFEEQHEYMYLFGRAETFEVDIYEMNRAKIGQVVQLREEKGV